MTEAAASRNACPARLRVLSAALAKAGVALFALSTFETDYILVKREQVRAAQEAFTSAGMKVKKGRKKAEPESKSTFTKK